MVRGAGWVGGDVGREVRVGCGRGASLMRCGDSVGVVIWAETRYRWDVIARGDSTGKETVHCCKDGGGELEMCERYGKSRGNIGNSIPLFREFVYYSRRWVQSG